MPQLFSFLNPRICAEIVKQKKLAFQLSTLVKLINPLGIQA